MAIDTSGEWWVGTESADIDPYLRALTEADDSYLVSSYRSIVCECGTDRFRLERAGDVARRECVSCGGSRLTCREIEDWDEAFEEEDPEAYLCVACGKDQVEIGVGFSSYTELEESHGVKWYYLGVRCAACGILSCFCDGKIGWGPSQDVYLQA